MLSRGRVTKVLVLKNLNICPLLTAIMAIPNPKNRIVGRTPTGVLREIP